MHISFFFFESIRITVLSIHLPLILLQSFRKLYQKLRIASNFQKNCILGIQSEIRNMQTLKLPFLTAQCKGE